MLTRLLAAVLLVCALALPAFAQDTFVTVTDVVGGVYHLPLTDCPTQGMTYNRTTNSFGCASGATYPAPGSNTQVLFNDSGVIGADAGFTYVKATDTATLGALVLGTALPPTSGGTGLAVYAVGDLVYASTTTVLSKLADVATGSVLVSGGVATAPAYSATPSLTSLTLTGATGNTLIVDTTTLVVDATNNRVGIGTASPSTPLHLVDARSDIAGSVTSTTLASTLTLTSNNANAWNSISLTSAVNQAAFDATAAGGTMKGIVINANATGVSGTVTLLAGTQASANNTGAGTLSLGLGYWALGPTNSGGGAYTEYDGFYASAGTAATTVRGFRGLHASNANRWNLYMDGTAQNFLAGNLGVGSGKSAPGQAVDVTGIVAATGGFLGVGPTAQVLTAGSTIAADACGGIKRISSASAVTTDTTNTITAPAAANLGCRMTICNGNAADAVTLDKNANILLFGGVDVPLLATCCLDVESTGASGVWKQVTAQFCSS